MYNTLGFGYLESVYEKSMLIELNKNGIRTENQKPVKVFYDDIEVGCFVADIMVNDEVIVELKSVRQLNKIHEAQVVNYLISTGVDLGLLINFGEQKVEVKRKYKTYNSRPN